MHPKGTPSLREAACRRLPSAALAALALAVAAGCGSSDEGGGSASAAPQSGGGGVNVAEAKKIVEQFKAAPAWNGPKAPIEGLAAQRGKLVVCVGSNFAVPFIKQMCDFGAEAFKAAGLRAQTIDGKGDPSNYNKAIRQAVSQGAAGIMLASVPADVIAPALKDAHAAGVKVITSANDPIDYVPPAEIGANVTVDYVKVGELQADYAIATTDGTVHAQGFNAPSFPSEVAQAKGTKTELARLCPKCTLNQESVLISNFPKTLPPTVQSKIRSNPKLNWILPSFDALNLYVVPSVTQAGAKGKVRTSSHNAIEGNLKFILDDNVQVMSVGENTRWWGWGVADGLMRLIVGQEVEPENIPLRIFDKDVLEQIGKDKISNQDALYGDVDYRANYRKLWGLG